MALLVRSRRVCAAVCVLLLLGWGRGVTVAMTRGRPTKVGGSIEPVSQQLLWGEEDRVTRESWGEGTEDPPASRDWQRQRPGHFQAAGGAGPRDTPGAGLGKRGKVSCKTPAESCSLGLLGTKVTGHKLPTAWLVLTLLTPWPAAASLSLSPANPLP